MKIGTLDINNLYVGGSQASAAYLGSTQVYPSQPTGQPNDEIWYTSTNNQVVIPYNTTGFGANIVSNTYGNKGVILFDNSITAIPDSAFSACTLLTSVEIPQTVTTLGTRSFMGSGLNNLIVPDNITTLGERVFQMCYSAETVSIGSGVTDLNYKMFANCERITSVIIPDTVVDLGDETFLDCKGLIEITIGSGVTTIGQYGLGRCTALTTINFNGTKSRWNSITKGNYWHVNAPATVVHCTDGDVAL